MQRRQDRRPWPHRAAINADPPSARSAPRVNARWLTVDNRDDPAKEVR
jgi:hypothetical protein